MTIADLWNSGWLLRETSALIGVIHEELGAHVIAYVDGQFLGDWLPPGDFSVNAVYRETYFLDKNRHPHQYKEFNETRRPEPEVNQMRENYRKRKGARKPELAPQTFTRKVWNEREMRFDEGTHFD